MLKKTIKQFSFILILTAMLTLPFLALAQISNGTIANRLERTGSLAGFSAADETSLAGTIGRIVNTALSFLGIIFVILIILGGYQWMTAGGNEEQVSQAKSRIKNAIIGLILVVSAFAIWRLVDQYLLNTNLL
ncbi:MAG: pilin [Patescibacteria group bacterium]|nr:pilin [Patescibacteria group bacterium]